MFNNTNLPVRYVPQAAAQQRGPYLEITCACRADHAWRIVFLPGDQTYCCPVCFGYTCVSIWSDGEIRIRGESTLKTDQVDRLRLVAMRFSAMPMMPLPNQANNLEDLLNSIG